MSTNNYNHKKIEKKWQKEWAKKKIYKTEEVSSKEKFYILDMFPYISGEGLHVGHPKGYIATDVVSRMKRMQGNNVLHPMGYDAFGLPAENYAIKTKTNPTISVKKNIKHFKEQLEIIGFDYDWTREINTSDPNYYRWTQWIFLKLLEKGLAYESYEPINWCPVDKTGLANEDVENGRCERCGALVEKRPMRQWVLKITDYAERLLADLDELDWPKSIKESQRNWIGKSDGAEIRFKLKDERLKWEEEIRVFTTRPDTLFGVTYLVLSPEHPLVSTLGAKLPNWENILDYIEQAKKRSEIDRTDIKKEKTGVELKGIKAVNPANKEEIPIWIADYVLPDYGTGAIMAVPAHDERDFQFAKKFNLPIKQVIEAEYTDLENPPRDGKENVYRKIVHVVVQNKKGETMLLFWKGEVWGKRKPISFLVGGIEDDENPVDAARREVLEEVGYKNLIHKQTLPFIARVHFYAAHKGVNRTADVTCVVFGLEDEEKREVSLEELEKHDSRFISEGEVAKKINIEDDLFFWHYINRPTAYVGTGILVNSGEFDVLNSEESKKKITEFVGGKMVTKYKLRDWVFSRQRYWGEPIPVIHCEKCALSNPAGRGIVPVPEKDLPVPLPKVKHYEPTGTGESPLAAISKWVNVKCPHCGGHAKRETNTMPQWAGSSWYYLRYMDPKNKKQLVDSKKEKYWAPVDLYVGGAEHATRHLIYARFWHKFLKDIGVVSTNEPFKRLQSVGLIMASDGRKMSKRWGNVIKPDNVIETFGADSLRVYEMFMGPFDQAVSWSTDNMTGSRRFLEKVWRLKIKHITYDIKHERQEKKEDAKIETLLHQSIKKVTEDISAFRFNTAISQLMIFVNECEKVEHINTETYGVLLRLLAPFAPHITEELWRSMGNKESIHIAPWPVFDLKKAVSLEKTIAIQVNGKVRAKIIVLSEETEAEIKKKAIEYKDILKWTEGKGVARIVYVPGRLVNIVLGE